MSRIAVHLLLFAIVSFAIVLLSALFAEPEDAAALRSLPRRFAVFLLGCGVLTAIMLIAEHTVASVD